MTRAATLAASAALLAILAGRTAAAQETPVAVEPAELAKRADLVGKLVSVDDRVRFFQNHPRVGYDELYLKRSSIPVRLPESLRPATPPRQPSVIVRGRLTREDSRLYLDAMAFEPQPADLERLDKAVAALPARDYQRRREWSRWAAKRARDFHDEPLAARARAVEAEALRIEADVRLTTVDAPREYLLLARQGRKGNVAEPAPSALAHRALRALLAAAETPAELEALRADVEEFFPKAATAPAPAAGRGVAGAVAEQYDQDPAAAYRTAGPEDREALDRRLWADVVEKRLKAQTAGDVKSALAAVDEAARLLPDRPAAAAELVARARERARAGLDALTPTEVKAVGGLLRDRANDPAAETELYRDWLQKRRERLGDADAEGPVALAAQYEALLHDQGSARELLERAWKIAPESTLVADAFKIRGYRREGDDWVKDAPAAAAAATADGDDQGEGLRGKSPAQVRAALGVEPDVKSVVATKGRTVLQWIFDGPRQRRYVNFVHLPGGSGPRVTSDFFLPR